jgi:hypothetical protein
MKSTRILRGGAVLFVVGVLFVEVSSKSDNGKIKGAILDVNYARVVNAIVRVNGGEIKRSLRSNGEGQFEISLPAGDYELTVEANGFRRFVYSSLKVQPNEIELINIHLDVADPKGLTPASREIAQQ